MTSMNLPLTNLRVAEVHLSELRRLSARTRLAAAVTGRRHLHRSP